MDYLAVVYFHVSLYSANGVAFSEIYAVINYNFTSLDPTFYLLIKTWFAKGEPSTQLSHMLFFSIVLSNLQWIIPENIHISTTKKIKLTPL